MTTIQLETVVGELKPDHIFHIELNRANRLNAMSRQMFADLQSIFAKVEQLKQTHDIRVVIFTARGKHFTAGLDLKEAPENFSFPEELDGARRSVRIYETIKDWQKSMDVLLECSVPVLVGIHGSCVGGGIDLITASDIRYCTSDAVFSIKEIDIGMAADLGTLQRINLVSNNPSAINELLYTGRQFSAQEAKDLGIVSRVANNYDELIKLLYQTAAHIASKSPVGIYTIKAVLRAQFKRNTTDNLELMARVNTGMLLTNDMLEAIRSNLTKTKAEYPKL